MFYIVGESASLSQPHLADREHCITRTCICYIAVAILYRCIFTFLCTTGIFLLMKNTKEAFFNTRQKGLKHPLGLMCARSCGPPVLVRVRTQVSWDRCGPRGVSAGLSASQWTLKEPL